MKKILSFLLISLLFTLTACELVKEVPNKNNKETDKSIVKEQETEKPIVKENPADHIFDIDLTRIQNDLNGKEVSIEGRKWKLNKENIINSEFGGSKVSQGKMEGKYHVIIKSSETDNKYELGADLRYNWENNTWKFIAFKSAYLVKLEAEQEKLDRDTRIELLATYNSIPQVIKEEKEIEKIVDTEEKTDTENDTTLEEEESIDTEEETETTDEESIDTEEETETTDEEIIATEE